MNKIHQAIISLEERIDIIISEIRQFRFQPDEKYMNSTIKNNHNSVIRLTNVLIAPKQSICCPATLQALFVSITNGPNFYGHEPFVSREYCSMRVGSARVFDELENHELVVRLYPDLSSARHASDGISVACNGTVMYKNHVSHAIVSPEQI